MFAEGTVLKFKFTVLWIFLVADKYVGVGLGRGEGGREADTLTIPRTHAACA